MFHILRNIILLIIMIGLLLVSYSFYVKTSGNNPLNISFDLLELLAKYLPNSSKNPYDRNSLYRFAVMSDIHSDKNYAQLALVAAKEKKVQYIVITGDWTKVGTKEELNEMKQIFDDSEIPYYSVPGDHDLWESGIANFRAVFGSPYQSFDKNGVHHILIDTSDTERGIGRDQMEWLKKDLSANNEKKILVFMHLPLYHPTSYRTIWEKQGENSGVKKETDELLSLLSDYGVERVFAGDHHLSSSYEEPSSGLKIRIVGAITLERNLQKPRFDLIDVFDDRSIEIEEVVLE